MKRNKLNKIIMIALGVAIFLITFIFMKISIVNANDQEEIVVVEFKETTKQVIEEPNIIEIKTNELLRKQKEILNIKDNKTYLLEYKKLIEEYSEWISDPPENIYHCFDEDELDLLFRVVEAEATAGEFDEKANVASVIFNRLDNKKFGNSLEEILVPSQFSPLADGRAYKVEITEDTILACEYAFMIDDTTDGAIFFEAKGSNVHAAYAEYMFTDQIGHSFYKEKNNGK